MATTSRGITEPGGSEATRIERVGAEGRRRALAVLLTGRPSERDPSVDQFLRFSRAQDLAVDELWLAWEGDRPAAATLIVPCRGRTAMQFLSPAASWTSPEVASRLVRTACQHQDPAQTRLIQALLDPDQRRTQQALAAAGYRELAVLTYLQGRIDAATPPRSLPEDLGDPALRAVHWSEADRPWFERAILASYEQTRDCPGLLGLRKIDEIIAGHMAAGTFRPELWTAVYDDRDQPAGVMLFNELAQGEGCELVYLGLSVPYRGRGLSRRLLRHGLAELAARGHRSLILAVDEANEPAVRLYRGMGFQTTGRKRAMIWPMEREVSSSEFRVPG